MFKNTSSNPTYIIQKILKKKMKNKQSFCGLVFIIILFTLIRFSTANIAPKSSTEENEYYDFSDNSGEQDQLKMNEGKIKFTTHSNSSTLLAGTTNSLKVSSNKDSLDLKLDAPLVNTQEFECPADCKCSKHTFIVDCSNLNLNKIPNNMPKNVQKLILSGNKLQKITTNAFDDLIEVREINLSRNQIEFIETSAFNSRLSSLEQIDLSFNQLKKLESNTFAEIPKLRKLFLNHNNLTIEDGQPLLNQSNLEELSLIGCTIEELYATTFVNLKGLQNLQLADNPLGEEINIEFFNPILNVKNLSMPQLSSDTIFKMCEKLISIDVINFETYDVSCFELISGQQFEESLVIKTITSVPTTPDYEKKEPNSFELMTTISVTNENVKMPVTTTTMIYAEHPSTSLVSEVKQPSKISNVEANTPAYFNVTSVEQTNQKITGVSNISKDTINKMLIGIIIIAVCGLVIGVICRRDYFGIKTKMCRTRRPLPTDQIRPSEVVPLNKITSS